MSPTSAGGPPSDVSPLEIEKAEGRLVVRGEIDLSNCGRLLDALVGVLERGGGNGTEVDVSGVSFMDSQGVAALLMATRSLTGDARLVLLDPAPFLRRLLRITGLDRHERIALEPGSEPGPASPADPSDPGRRRPASALGWPSCSGNRRRSCST